MFSINPEKKNLPLLGFNITFFAVLISCIDLNFFRSMSFQKGLHKTEHKTELLEIMERRKNSKECLHYIQAFSTWFEVQGISDFMYVWVDGCDGNVSYKIQIKNSTFPFFVVFFFENERKKENEVKSNFTKNCHPTFGSIHKTYSFPSIAKVRISISIYIYLLWEKPSENVPFCKN